MSTSLWDLEEKSFLLLQLLFHLYAQQRYHHSHSRTQVYVKHVRKRNQLLSSTTVHLKDTAGLKAHTCRSCATSNACRNTITLRLNSMKRPLSTTAHTLPHPFSDSELGCDHTSKMTARNRLRSTNLPIRTQTTKKIKTDNMPLVWIVSNMISSQFSKVRIYTVVTV